MINQLYFLIHSNDGTTKLLSPSSTSSSSRPTTSRTCSILGSMVSSFIPDTSSAQTTTTKLEHNIPKPNIINVRIVSPIGTVANITFPRTTLGYDVKLEALKCFTKDLTKLPGMSTATMSNECSMKMHMKHFRLIKSRIEFDFDEQMSLADANTTDNGRN